MLSAILFDLLLSQYQPIYCLLLYVSMFYKAFVITSYFSIINIEIIKNDSIEMAFLRTILKQDLAHKLFPQSSNVNAAMQLLRKEIKLSPELNNKLNLMTRNKGAHYYTHKELEIILEYFCISEEEFEML